MGEANIIQRPSSFMTDSNKRLNNMCNDIFIDLTKKIEHFLCLSIATIENCTITEVTPDMAKQHGEKVINCRNGEYELGWTTYYYKGKALFGVGNVVDTYIPIENYLRS